MMFQNSQHTCEARKTDRQKIQKTAGHEPETYSTIFQLQNMGDLFYFLIKRRWERRRERGREEERQRERCWEDVRGEETRRETSGVFQKKN